MPVEETEMSDGSRRVFSYSPWRPLLVIPAILMFGIPLIVVMLFFPGGILAAGSDR